MKLYRCKMPWFSGMHGEPEPCWPQDYREPEEIPQEGSGDEALKHAFSQCHIMGRDMRLGDVVVLNSGEAHRCEMSGWAKPRQEQQPVQGQEQRVEKWMERIRREHRKRKWTEWLGMQSQERQR